MNASWRRLGQAAVPRISKNEPTPYSWISDAAAGPSRSGPLAGRAIAIKENISYSRAPTSCLSDILDDYYPPYNATCIDSLIRAGATIVGQTKMDEFGMGSETRHIPSRYSPVHNPASPRPDEPPRSAGGSSGGSAAAVAEGSSWAWVTPLNRVLWETRALGTDTGGSVRLPASYCGVVGLKPSYGMISRHGVIAYADSLDCVGVLGRDVDTVQEVFTVLSHPDTRDMTCVTGPLRQRAVAISGSHEVHLSDLPKGRLKGLRIGLPLQTHLPDPYLRLPNPLLRHLQSLGATLHPVDLPSFAVALPAYYVLASAEASSNLARFGGGWFGSKQEKEREVEGEDGEQRRRRIRTEGFGKEVKKRILAGAYALSASEFNNTYLKALHLRRTLRQEFQQTLRIPHPQAPTAAPGAPMDGVDVLLHPTAIRTAPPLAGGEKDESEGSQYLQDLLTVPASLAGLPALSVPAGKGSDGWPVGVSLVSQWGMEDMLFGVGRAITDWNH